jgi:C-terminal processing protease CtpA/Prc
MDQMMVTQLIYRSSPRWTPDIEEFVVPLQIYYEKRSRSIRSLTRFPAEEASIQAGDVIQAVNRKPVKNVEDFVKTIEKAKGSGNLLLLVQRGQDTLFVSVTPR